MLKRTIFLLSYFAFLILAPIAVYYFWPVETEYVSPPDMEMMVDPDIPNANEELEDVVKPALYFHAVHFLFHQPAGDRILHLCNGIDLYRFLDLPADRAVVFYSDRDLNNFWND